MTSPIDKIFEEIFGKIPSKSGTAFELIAAIATQVIIGGEVKHDDKLRGQFSKTLYQIDVHQTTDGVMGEAKDYSDRNSKVGRGDLQKLGGALPDLKEIKSGTFFSATGYTKPAQKYAKAAEKIIGKPITLYELRPSTELDEQGFIKTVIVKLFIMMPMTHLAKWTMHITEKGKEALKSLLAYGEDGHQFYIKCDHFYDADGCKILSLHELTSQGYGDINDSTQKAHACFVLKNHYIKIKGVLAEINGLEYEMPYSYDMKEIRITDDSEHRFVVLDSNGFVLKFLTDKQIRDYELDDYGSLKKK